MSFPATSASLLDLAQKASRNLAPLNRNHCRDPSPDKAPILKKNLKSVCQKNIKIDKPLARSRKIRKDTSYKYQE